MAHSAARKAFDFTTRTELASGVSIRLLTVWLSIIWLMITSSLGAIRIRLLGNSSHDWLISDLGLMISMQFLDQLTHLTYHVLTILHRLRIISHGLHHNVSRIHIITSTLVNLLAHLLLSCRRIDFVLLEKALRTSVLRAHGTKGRGSGNRLYS